MGEGACSCRTLQTRVPTPTPQPSAPTCAWPQSVAVYVHIPWCAAICPYCDFDKQASDFRLVDEYIDAVVRHMDGQPRRLSHSLYFGGGTPSLLTPERLSRLIRAWRTRFSITASPEITVESNPSDIVAHKVQAYLGAGVSRISLGMQSLDDDELRFLGRRHTADKAVRATRAVREAGCRNLSLDLMYGLPGQTIDAVRHSLAGLLALEPDHVSCYALTLEPGTPMGAEAAAGRLDLPEDDVLADQYAAIQAMLAEAGLRQYELSNWALPGHESIHNLTYWRNGEWIGLGAGAAGSSGGRRYKRTPIVRDYIAAAQQGDPGFTECESWTRKAAMRDTLMLGLRLADGITNPEFEARFGVSLRDYCGERLDDLVGKGVLHWREDRLALDPASYFVCNSVLSELLPS
jgi:oxygen-independent coproporphyrinogen III oxidase